MLTGCHLVVAVGLEPVENGAVADQRGLSGPGAGRGLTAAVAVCSSVLTPASGTVGCRGDRCPHPLPASHSCFLLRLPAGTQPSPATPTGAGTQSLLTLPHGLEGPLPVTLEAGTLGLSNCPVGHGPSQRGWTERSWLPAGGLAVTGGGRWPPEDFRLPR